MLRVDPDHQSDFEDVKVQEFIPDILQHITGCKPA